MPKTKSTRKPKNADKYHLAIRLRMYPSDRQKQIIKRNSDASRWIYNELVGCGQRKLRAFNYIADVYLPFSMYSIKNKFYAIRFIDYRLKKPNPKYSTKPLPGLRNLPYFYAGVFSNQIVEIKKHVRTSKSMTEGIEWIHHKDISSMTLGMAQRSYNSAWNMFRKVHSSGVPKFRKKDPYTERYLTYGHTKSGEPKDMFHGDSRFLDTTHMRLPKIGRIRVSHAARFLEKYDPFQCKIMTVSIKKDNLNHYWVALSLESNKRFKPKLRKNKHQVGIDLNLSNFCTTSTGESVDNPHFYKKQAKRLARYQRVLSRRQLRAKKDGRKLRESKNYQKQRMKVARLQNHVTNQREHFLHEQSTKLIKSNDLLVAEDLGAKNMLKNHALSKNIQDVGWSIFLEQLRYKADLYGRDFKQVDPKYTTQMCNDCGHVCKGSEHIKLGKERWTCPSCGKKHIRDHNAAKNILDKGLSSK